MSRTEEERLLILAEQNNIILNSIFRHLQSPTEDMKDFIINVIANNIGRK